MINRTSPRIESKTEADAETILENVIQLDELLDDSSGGGLETLPFLELSKYLRIRKS
jgi:hypothetical protein